MPLPRCARRSELLPALVRRPPLKIPAFGFSFRGAGESYRTSAPTPLPGFRRDDLVTIRRAAGSADGELDWNRTDGIARPSSDEMLVSLGAVDCVAYDLVS